MKPLSNDRLFTPGKAVIKICGLTRPEDAAFCAGAGADWLGFIFHPQSPRAVTPEEAAGFETGEAKRVGVFVEQSAAEILDIMARARLDLAQLHGGQDEDCIRRIGAGRVVSVHWPEKHSSSAGFQQSLAKTGEAAYHLFDAGSHGGGHGRTLDLGLIKTVRPPRPWLLAGGLSPDSVNGLDLKGLANFFGLDFNSGLEDRPGQKSEAKVLAAVSAARKLFNKFNEDNNGKKS